MEILFTTAKLRRSCTEAKAMMKAHGPTRGKILRRRLDQLRAAPSLAVMRSLPGRCHELAGNRKGTLAIDLDGPFRLVFEPANDPVPRTAQGGLDWNGVSVIRVLGVEDYHG
jgi:proteic killer suppression protein